jgi:stage II sporulation protein D
VSSFKNRPWLAGFPVPQVPAVPKKALLRVLACFLLLAGAGCAGGRYLQVKRPGETKGAERAQEPPASSLTIRVAAERGVRSLVIAGRGVRIASFDGTAALASGAVIEIGESSARIGGTVLPLPITLSSPGGVTPLEMNGRRFDGELVVFRDLVVNVLPLETYLKGVLASEIPGGWPAESLKAQAVVSRTFALRKIIDREGEPFDVDDSEMDQKYAFPGRNPPIENAIEETEGIVLSYGGAPIEAFFHASSGGVTESCRNVFQRDLPYLRSARDPYTERAGEPGWTCDVNAGVIAKRVSTLLVKAAGSDGLKDVRVRSRTESGRVREFALFFGKGGEYVVKGNDFRLALDPKTFKSLLLDRIERKTVNGGTVFSFSGKGYGHGVGMSQLGAKTMAEMGFGYREILGFYYRGARVERWNER